MTSQWDTTLSGGEVVLAEWGAQIIDELTPLVEAVDDALGGRHYREARAAAAGVLAHTLAVKAPPDGRPGSELYYLGGLLAYAYLSGEHITHMEKGRPLFVRTPESRFTLSNFMRTHLFSSLGALRIGLDILFVQEQVKIDQILGHGVSRCAGRVR